MASNSPFLLLLSLLATFFVPRSESSGSGVDLSQLHTTTQLSCLVSNGYNFLVVRGYRSSASPDPNAPGSVANGWAAGMRHVDLYLFPDPNSTKTATQQVQEMVSYMSVHNVTYENVWLDVEAANLWTGSTSLNQAFMTELIAACYNANLRFGVYSDTYEWSGIFGTSTGYTAAQNLPLWYPHWDNTNGFADFIPFGGWTTPVMKQTQGNVVTLCSSSIDTNWYSSESAVWDKTVYPYMCPSTSLNIRSGPGTGNSVLWVAQPCEAFTALNFLTTGWAYLQAQNGTFGYASTTYLKRCTACTCAPGVGSCTQPATTGAVSSGGVGTTATSTDSAGVRVASTQLTQQLLMFAVFAVLAALARL